MSKFVRHKLWRVRWFYRLRLAVVLWRDYDWRFSESCGYAFQDCWDDAQDDGLSPAEAVADESLLRRVRSVKQ